LSTHPDTHERITKLQKDVEQIKEELQDQWHERRPIYEDRIRKTLSRDKNAAILFLEMDGKRSMIEIERDLAAKQITIIHMTLWRASLRLVKAGLITKVDVKGTSPVYSKKQWAIVLDMDDYVRTEFLT
jgi:predicted Zn-dependent protease